MGESITNYTFTIINDEAVPLAGNFDQVMRVPVFTIVAIGLILLVVCSYTLWAYSKMSRIKEISEIGAIELISKYYLHPQRLVDACEECEHNALSGNVI